MKQLEIKSAEGSSASVAYADFDFDSDAGIEFPNPADVDFELRLEIGEVDRDWGEVFFVRVVTPNNRPRNNPSARFVLLPFYSFEALKLSLMKTLATCERNTWDECFEELCGHFRWEYG